MNIGFDAKRAYHNSTGLGNYSRTLISSLTTFFPEHQYYLFNPKPSLHYNFEDKQNVHEVLPNDFFSILFPKAWRSSFIKPDLKKRHIDLYHGLSHEIPFNIKKTRVRAVVTIHDLIHKRYAEQFGAINAKIYNSKSRYACKNADKVIAISNQTKQDIVEFYGLPEERITVCYQSCSNLFSMQVSDEQKKNIKTKYGLPDNFFLYVGSVIERKNLLNICKALFILKNKLDVPLVVIGNGKSYKRIVKNYITKNGLQKKVIFLSEQPSAKHSQLFRNGEDFPAIYQSASAMIYPSIFEGFGIPVLEALFSKLPVITSNVSSLPEAGGSAAYYVDPLQAEEIAIAMEKIFTDRQLSLAMQEKGWLHAQNFTQQKCAASVMNVYQSLF